MPLHRTVTRRGPPPGAVPKPKKGYEKVEQGLEQLYPDLSSDKKTDME
jgi:hypothetical protein